MGIGIPVWSGQATIAAGTPGVKGSITVAKTTVSADDSIVVTYSHTAEQDVSKIKGQDYTFQVVKDDGVGFTIYCNQYQNPAIIVDYMIVSVSS